MTDALVAATAAVRDRLLQMELAAVPDAVAAAPRWWHIEQSFPYWVNHLVRIPPPTGPDSSKTYTLTIFMRLVLGQVGAALRGETEAANVQNRAWEYGPAVVRYFEAHRRMNPPDMVPTVRHIGAEGVTIELMRPLDLTTIRLPVTAMLTTLDFSLEIPLVVGDDDV